VPRINFARFVWTLFGFAFHFLLNRFDVGAQSGSECLIQGELRVEIADDFIHGSSFVTYKIQENTSQRVLKVEFQSGPVHQWNPGQVTIRGHLEAHDHFIVSDDESTHMSATGNSSPFDLAPICTIPRDLSSSQSALRLSLQDSAASATTPALAVPILHSNPNAPTKLFLQFGGAPSLVWNGESIPPTPPFDLDGNPQNLSALESSTIHDIWAGVSEKYSIFNIDVTTEPPSDMGHLHAAEIIIGGDGSWYSHPAGGAGLVGSFANPKLENIGFVFSDRTGETSSIIVDEIAHEAGHGFGLVHQSVYDSTGKLFEEYNPGDALAAPLMGTAYHSARGKWWLGRSVLGFNNIQDDLAVLSSATNGFGYRQWGYGTDANSAVTLTSDNGVISSLGILVRASDKHWFSFQTSGGTLTINGNVADITPMLHIKLELRDAEGQLLVTQDTPNLNQTISTQLPEGRYYLVVGSHGSYGDVGQFQISGSIPTLSNSLTAPSGLAATQDQNNHISLEWNDSSAVSQISFEIQRSSDSGHTWMLIGTPSATNFVDSSVQLGQDYQYRVRAVSGGTTSFYSNSISLHTTATPTTTPPLFPNIPNNGVGGGLFNVSNNTSQDTSGGSAAIASQDSSRDPGGCSLVTPRNFGASGFPLIFFHLFCSVIICWIRKQAKSLQE